MRLPLSAVLVLSVTLAVSAQKYKASDFADFTRSSTEHQLIIIDQPFVVRSVSGYVGFREGPGQSLKDVLFEIEGPGSTKKIRRARSTDKGRFRIAGVPDGSYRFKATLDGFSSVLGYIVVSHHAQKIKRIDIEMGIGN